MSAVNAWLEACSQAPGQVHHQKSPQAELFDLGGLGLCSSTVMIRTGLFPHNRARLRNATPSPLGFFKELAAAFAHSLSSSQWRLPSLAECAALVPEAPTPTLGEAEPSRPPADVAPAKVLRSRVKGRFAARANPDAKRRRSG
jgi:hypothetical protein